MRTGPGAGGEWWVPEACACFIGGAFLPNMPVRQAAQEFVPACPGTVHWEKAATPVLQGSPERASGLLSKCLGWNCNSCRLLAATACHPGSLSRPRLLGHKEFPTSPRTPGVPVSRYPESRVHHAAGDCWCVTRSTWG